MNYTKAMIDLVKEIRRRMPMDEKADIKLANPDLFSILHVVLINTNDAVAKALIKELFSLAGEPWADYSQPKSTQPQASYTVYRGQMSLKPREVEELAQVEEKRKFSSQRIYRGQLVSD